MEIKRETKKYKWSSPHSPAIGCPGSTHTETIDISTRAFDEFFGGKICHGDSIEVKRKYPNGNPNSSIFGTAIGFTSNDTGFRFWIIKDGYKEVEPLWRGDVKEIVKKNS